MQLYEELAARGLIAQVTNEDEIREMINAGKATFYIGFDCTADSLTAGHFMALTLMKRLQMAGNRPIALIGGGTGMIGDPSGRSDLRTMMTKETIAHNCECFKKQMSRFIEFGDRLEEGSSKALMVNNADWLMDLNYIEFIRELSIPCRANGIVLSVDNYVPTEYTAHYDRAEQGIVADYVIVMGYDEHYAGSPEAGSVASIDFVEEGIERTVEQVPAHKVINAVPFYTRIWETKGAELGSQAVGMAAAEEYVRAHNIALEWDEETCQNYGEYTEDGSLFQVWLEDERSIEVKLNIMEKYQIGGVAGWRLGFEKPEIWDVIGVYLNR